MLFNTYCRKQQIPSFINYVLLEKKYANGRFKPFTITNNKLVLTYNKTIKIKNQTIENSVTPDY